MSRDNTGRFFLLETLDNLAQQLLTQTLNMIKPTKGQFASSDWLCMQSCYVTIFCHFQCEHGLTCNGTYSSRWLKTTKRQIDWEQRHHDASWTPVASSTKTNMLFNLKPEICINPENCLSTKFESSKCCPRTFHLYCILIVLYCNFSMISQSSRNWSHASPTQLLPQNALKNKWYMIYLHIIYWNYLLENK